MASVKQKLARRLGDWERRPGTALVRSLPTALGDGEGRAGGLRMAPSAAAPG